MCHLWDWLKNECTDVYKDCRICDFTHVKKCFPVLGGRRGLQWLIVPFTDSLLNSFE